MSWNPDLYLSFAAERTRPAAELIARIFADTPSRVADLGCGPGNSTAIIGARWPNAQIDGIDNSAEMLAQARNSGIRANWMQADIADWKAGTPYDVVVSNATLQWLPDHETLLPELLENAIRGGWFAFQVPRNFDEPCHTLLQDLARDRRWAPHFAAMDRRAGVLKPEHYYEILAARVSAIDIWETRYVQQLSGEDAVFRWMSGTGARPYFARLDGTNREEFEEEYRARLRAAYPQRTDGVTLFPFLRLFAVARR